MKLLLILKKLGRSIFALRKIRGLPRHNRIYEYTEEVMDTNILSQPSFGEN
jgi:hypothetical protein